MTCSHRSIVCDPSIRTSGSTIGTSCCSWQSAAYLASAWALALDASRAWQIVVDVDYGSPFREARPEAGVLFEPIAESIEPFGHGFARRTGERLRARIDLDAWHDPLFCKHLRERRPASVFLADRLVLHDDAADEFGGGRKREQHLPVRAAALVVDLIPSASNRLVRVVTVSSAARMPLPRATRSNATARRSWVMLWILCHDVRMLGENMQRIGRCR